MNPAAQPAAVGSSGRASPAPVARADSCEPARGRPTLPARKGRSSPGGAPHFLHRFHIHLAAAIPNGLIVEHFPALDFLFEERCVVEEGYMHVPQRPGLTLRQEAVEQYLVP
jgi:hypothetical protein